MLMINGLFYKLCTIKQQGSFVNAGIRRLAPANLLKILSY